MPGNEFGLGGQPHTVTIFASRDLTAERVAQRLVRRLGPH
jgi:hypothetical protein